MNSTLSNHSPPPDVHARYGLQQGLRLALVGPMAPPAGGMAQQTAQMCAVLRSSGAQLEFVATNPLYYPAYVAGWRGVRALCRLLPYLVQLWRVCGRVQLVHLMANSGWSWHLSAAPAIWIARLRGVPVLLNYRGGDAAHFLQREGLLVRASMASCGAIVVPSDYLRGVFITHQLSSVTIPNGLDPARFSPPPTQVRRANGSATIVMTRHLEAIYDHATALRTLQYLLPHHPSLRMVICGEGPERAALVGMAAQLGISAAVDFKGACTSAEVAALLSTANLYLNTSVIDNAPNSIVEAWACGVPVVSTAAGGIPNLVHDGADALLAPLRNPAALCQQISRVLTDPQLAARLAQQGLDRARQHHWPALLPRWQAQYQHILLRQRRSCYTQLVSACLFPLQERLKRHRTVVKLAQLERSQWQSAAELGQMQQSRLVRLLDHAAHRVPYYRERLQADYAGLQSIRHVSDLAKLPLLRKAAIQQYFEQFSADHAGPLKAMSTGGSSGEPLRFLVGKERVSHDVAARWRCMRWWGVDMGDKEALMWGSPLELGKQDRLRAWRDRLLRSRLLPAFDLRPATLADYLQQLQRQRPAIMSGYPSTLCALAEYAQASRVRLDQLGVKVLFVTAERLYEQQRQLLEQCFAAPVANGYGGRDSGFIAHQCPAGGMHICAEDILVEIVDEHDHVLPPGQTGQIVITHLASADFPFIRYATGDYGALSPDACHCGRSLPLLQQIDGRSTDFIVASDGTVMHGLALIYILRELPYVRSFRIIQESLLLVRVQLVLRTGALPDLDREIVLPLRRRLGPEVEIALEVVPALSAEASGKFRYIINRMPAAITGVRHAHR